MTDDQQELLVEAQDSIDAAKLLLENGFAGYAAVRAYYAMLYVEEFVALANHLLGANEGDNE